MPRNDDREPLLVADAGVPYRVAPADPIAAWIDLMEAVEALAPRPPACQPRVLHDARL